MVPRMCPANRGIHPCTDEPDGTSVAPAETKTEHCLRDLRVLCGESMHRRQYLLQELLGPRVFRRFEKLRWLCFRKYFALVDKDHAVCNLAGKPHFMSDHAHRHPC